MRRLALALLAAGLGGCGHYEENPFPLELGFQPLEACTAPEPARSPGTCPETPYLALTGPVGTRDGNDWGHARAFVNATLDEVWAAMQDPNVCRVHETSSWGVVSRGTEPFPMSFVIRYVAGPFFAKQEWEITYRGGVLEGTATAPGAYGMRAQKTWGTSFVDVQSISVVARAVATQQTEGVDCVLLEMVGWLAATTRGQAEAIGLTQDFYYAITAWLHGQPIPE